MNPSPNATPTGGQTDSPLSGSKNPIVHALAEIWHTANDHLHRAHCTCGWAGEFGHTEQTAEADLAAHLASIAAIEATS